MSAAADLVRKLGALGADHEMIAAALEALEAVIEEQRAGARERKRRQRQNMSRDVTGQDVTERDVTQSGSPDKGPPDPLKITLPKDPFSDPKGSSFPKLAKQNGFAGFWEAYPSKVGKRAAETAYDRAVRRIEEPDPASALLAGLERSKTSKRWADPTYTVPNPATWLNQDRWLDEPETGPPKDDPSRFRPGAPETPELRADRIARFHAELQGTA